MEEIFDKICLLALPASGKSEVRKFLANIPDEARARIFHIGKMVQLDDFPYVHLMRVIDAMLVKMGLKPAFFSGSDMPFYEGVFWGVLNQLLNEDYKNIMKLSRWSVYSLENAGRTMLTRYDMARNKMDQTHLFAPANGKLGLNLEQYGVLCQLINKEALKVLTDKNTQVPESMDGVTLVFEFARGGSENEIMPLDKPLEWGYAKSLGIMDPEILNGMAVVYVKVSHKESMRRNMKRADPNDPGSELKHGVPKIVMEKDYGCDDIGYMLEKSTVVGAIEVILEDNKIPIACSIFDNEEDKTSFVRDDDWQEQTENVQVLNDELALAMQEAWDIHTAVHAFQEI